MERAKNLLLLWKRCGYFLGILSTGLKMSSDGISPTSRVKRGGYPHIFWCAGFIHKVYLPYYDYE